MLVLGSTLFQTQMKLQKLITENLMSWNLKIIFTSLIKDKLPKILLLEIVYKCKCGGCNATHFGKAKRHF